MKNEKQCLNCGILYTDLSKRKTSKTCSKKCAYELGVRVRKNNGSYISTNESNEKRSISLKKKYDSGERVVSEENRKKLSTKNKSIWSDPQLRIERVELIKKISLEKYDSHHYTQSNLVKEKKEATNLKKYGSIHPCKNKEVVDKIIETKKERGIIPLYEQKTAIEWAEEKKISKSWFRELVREYGFDFAKSKSKEKTNIETILENFLLKNNILYKRDETISLYGKKYRPDFFIENFNIGIECDGLYWHSDRIQEDMSYHKNKKDFFLNLGIDLLFFRANEIESKTDIVFSIIKNKLLSLDSRYYARKLVLKNNIDCSVFFEHNHLMGNGFGRYYCLVDNDNNIIQAMQVKWRDTKNKCLEISRFCSKNYTSVVGGFSRLLQYVIKNEYPNVVITFIDKRYGNGEYLENFGFKKKTEYLSFGWTDNQNVYHRMAFPGNSGYEKNMAKIWDCGQAKWELRCNL